MASFFGGGFFAGGFMTSGTSQTFHASTAEEAIIKAMVHLCKPCCGPCGDAGCPCCPGVRWWASAWHQSWDEDTPKYTTGTPGPTYTLTDYSMTLVPAPADFYYFGDVASEPGNCQIGGIAAVDGECIAGDPIHILTGTVTYTDGMTETEFAVDYYCNIVLVWDCGSPTVSSTFFGLWVDGVQGGTAPFLAVQASCDIGLAVNGNTDETGLDTASCGFTLDLSLLHLPDLTIIPIT